MDLADSIRTAIHDGHMQVSLHARRRLHERAIEFWQIEAGADQWMVVEERPHDLPNPSIVAEQELPDGTKVVVVWARQPETGQALLVTVYFPEGS